MGNLFNTLGNIAQASQGIRPNITIADLMAMEEQKRKNVPVKFSRPMTPQDYVRTTGNQAQEEAATTQALTSGLGTITEEVPREIAPEMYKQRMSEAEPKNIVATFLARKYPHLEAIKGLVKEGQYDPETLLKAAKSGDLSGLKQIPDESKLPYKIGERHTFTGKDGKSYEGTFKGLTDTNEPIFENATEIKGKPIQTELNPYQKFSAGHQLRNEIKANPYIKDYQDVSQKYAVMQRALKESQTSKTLVAVDQALITLFNKMTDPTSVVRESEYARTPEDMAIYNRIQGKIDKLRTGGAGMTAEERNALVRMAQNFMEVYQGNYDQTISDYKELANQSGLDPKVVGIPYERKSKQTQKKDKLKQKYGLE